MRVHRARGANGPFVFFTLQHTDHTPSLSGIYRPSHTCLSLLLFLVLFRSPLVHAFFMHAYCSASISPRISSLGFRLTLSNVAGSLLVRSFSLRSVRFYCVAWSFFSCFFGLSLDSECLACGGRGLGTRVLCRACVFFYGVVVRKVLKVFKSF